MGNSGWQIRSVIVRFFECLLKLYPPAFRSEFSAEIQDVILSRVRNAAEHGWIAWLSAVFQEIMGLVPSIFQERWHEFKCQREGAMVPVRHVQWDGFMKTMAYIRWADPPVWKVTLADFLPLWLLSITFIGLGMGPLPIVSSLEGTAFLLAIAVTILLLWMRWLTPELILYSLFPIIPAMLFEEISLRYALPFFILCTFFLTTGIAGYRLSLYKDSIGLGWLLLLIVFIGTWWLALHANQNYWQMLGDLGYTCVPDTQGCTPLTGSETPWWVLFFSW